MNVPNAQLLLVCNYSMFGPLKKSFEDNQSEYDKMFEAFAHSYFENQPRSFYDNNLPKITLHHQVCTYFNNLQNTISGLYWIDPRKQLF